ncbi:flagellar protein FlgN [Stakelama marina]|uniref:Flagellar protein FlgN n=1 Tax=Stakelama marina TaxID=2826939 RepID=A0A8T4IGG1_9SPHN|nr:flagellar protein FlgN [Stakelama marina]MBR0553122.1 flagellar protein FlgN [Stakelama marina]
MTRRDALVQVIENLHAEIAALKANDIKALEAATAAKLGHIQTIANDDEAPPTTELRQLAEEANRLNETARIYVNLMAANVRRRLQNITGGAAAGAYGATYHVA